MLPKRLRHVEPYLFGGCEGLESVTLPINTECLLKCDIYGSGGPLKVIIPEGVTVLRQNSLWGCERLSELYLPCSLTVMETGALYGCRRLSRIYFPNGMNESFERVDLSLFDFCPKLVLFDYIFNNRFILFPARNDAYDLAVWSGFLLRLLENVKARQKYHKLILGRILRASNADISLKGLGADTPGGLLRLVILKHGGLATVEDVDAVMNSGVFENDAEVITILMECRRRLGASGGADNLIL